MDGIAVKDSGDARRGRGEAREVRHRGQPLMLTPLYEFDSFRPASDAREAGRSVIAVATCNDSNREPKARAIRVLLEHKLLTHLCVSASLAEELTKKTDRRE